MTKPRIAAKSLKKTAKTSKKAPKRSAESVARIREAAAARMRAGYDALTAVEKLELRWRRSAKPPLPRAGSNRASVKRNTSIAVAYCDWSDHDEVVRMYQAAAIMTELTGVPYVVDHTVPVQHPLVCGLHTHTNLQVVSNTMNRLKGNWIWPEMWPSCEESMLLLEQLAAEQQEDRLEAANDHEQPAKPARPKRRARA